MKRLNLGAGYTTPEDWTNCDLHPSNELVEFADVLDRLPYEDETFDFVLMNHTLQMFHYDELPVVLSEVKRVMKPGATLRILTPDLGKALEAYQSMDWNYYPISNDLEPTLAGKFARYLFWHGDTRCAFTFLSLDDLLDRNDFTNIMPSEFGKCELDSREKESLIVECKK